MSSNRERAVRCDICEAVFRIPEGPRDGRIPLEYRALICPECYGAFAIKVYYPTDDELKAAGLGER